MTDGPGGVEISPVWHEGHLRERATSEDLSRRHCLLMQVRQSVPGHQSIEFINQDLK